MDVFQAPVIQIVVALVLVYAILSQLSSVLLELLNRYIVSYSRGAFLKGVLEKLLDGGPDGPNILHRIYIHPLVASQTESQKSLPSYLSANTFSAALVDVIRQIGYKQSFTVKTDPAGVKTYMLVSQIVESDGFQLFSSGMLQLPESPLKDTLSQFWHQASGGIALSATNMLPDPKQQIEIFDRFQALIQHWYNDYMDRTTGWYKKGQQKPLLILGLVSAILLNADFFHILHTLQVNPGVTAQLSEMGLKIGSEGAADTNMLFSQALKKVNSKDRKLIQMPDSVLNDTLKGIKYGVINRYLQIDTFLAGDSIARALQAEADTLSDILHKYQIPFGWDLNQAPASWFRGGISEKERTRLTKLPDGLYQIKRNESFWSLSGIFWLFGILISGILISRGAPFWFDILIKFANIRQAGKKPTEK